MSVRVTQNSFSKGILSPALSARIDLEQYQTGLKKLLNGIVMQEGCVVNRSGLEFISKAKYDDKKVRLIPFVFNFSQNYVIEAGDRYFRFIRDGGYILDNNDEIYEIETPYLEEDLFGLDYVQQADTITIVHQNYPPKELVRYQHNEWELNNIKFEASILPPQNVSAVYTGSTSSNTTTYSYVVCSVDDVSKEESKRSQIVNVVGHLEAYWTSSEYITISWEAVSGAVEYNIYRSVNGIFAYVGTSVTTSFKDNNIEPDLKVCAPVVQNPFENENPSSVCYYRQRKIFASSAQSPQTFWASQTNTNNNFNISRPLNSTDSITMSIYDDVNNKINHLIPFDDLIVMTTSAEWSINGKDGIFSANPAPIAKLQSYYGSNKIKPVISGSMVLFVQSGGTILRDLGYSYLTDSYDGEELTIFANQLFEGKQIVDMAYSKEPYRIVWCVMNDGSLNGLTYNPKQKISAWHTHKTKGKFKSVCTVRENNEDIAYFVVERTINNETVNYIERFKTRIINSMEDAFFVDSGIKAEFENAVTSISGLEHLKNEEVIALLDFGVVEKLVVSQDGTLTLPYPAKKVTIGIPYLFELETLNLETDGTLGINKLINKIEVKILNSREDFFIENFDKTLSQNARSHDSVNYPDKLYSKSVIFTPFSNPSKEASVKIVQKYPLPINILSVSTILSLEEIEAN